MLLSFSTLVLQSSTMTFMIESLLFCHFHIVVGIFHYRTWLVYSYDGLPQMPQVFMSKRVGCTPTKFLFVELSYIYSASASFSWQSLLLMLTSIDGHLHSPLISLVNVRLSPFLSSPQPPFYSTYSAMSMAHAHILRESCKSLRILKYETIAWLLIGVVHDLNFLCGEDRAQPDYMILQG